jgi:GNAT superfamily N-acetyltransferase
MITFGTVSLNESMVFDDVYEPELQLEIEEKAELLKDAITIYMFVGGKVAGETFGLPTDKLEEKLPNVIPSSSIIYCYSTTLLPIYQGQGLGSILKAYWLGMLRAHGYTRVCSHATSPAALKLAQMFGVITGPQYENWCGSKRTAIYYEGAV